VVAPPYCPVVTAAPPRCQLADADPLPPARFPSRLLLREGRRQIQCRELPDMAPHHAM
jgi:hypothetical protein